MPLSCPSFDSSLRASPSGAPGSVDPPSSSSNRFLLAVLLDMALNSASKSASSAAPPRSPTKVFGRFDCIPRLLSTTTALSLACSLITGGSNCGIELVISLVGPESCWVATTASGLLVFGDELAVHFGAGGAAITISTSSSPPPTAIDFVFLVAPPRFHGLSAALFPRFHGGRGNESAWLLTPFILLFIPLDLRGGIAMRLDSFPSIIWLLNSAMFVVIVVVVVVVVVCAPSSLWLSSLSLPESNRLLLDALLEIALSSANSSSSIAAPPRGPV